MKRAARIITLILMLSILSACSMIKDLLPVKSVESSSSNTESAEIVSAQASITADETENIDEIEDTAASKQNSEVSLEETVLCDQDGVKITVTGIAYDEWMDPQISVTIENNRTENICVQAQNTAVNGYMVYMSLSCSVVAGKKAVDSIYLYTDDLEVAGIEQIGSIEFSLSVFNDDTWDDIFTTEQFVLYTNLYGTFEQPAVSGGTVIYDANNIKITALGLTEDEWIGTAIYIYVENNGDRDITIQTQDSSVNGFMIYSGLSTDVLAGKKCVDYISLYSSDLENAGIEKIENFEFYFTIFDMNSWDDMFDSEIITLTFQRPNKPATKQIRTVISYRNYRPSACQKSVFDKLSYFVCYGRNEFALHNSLKNMRAGAYFERIYGRPRRPPPPARGFIRYSKNPRLGSLTV